MCVQCLNLNPVRGLPEPSSFAVVHYTSLPLSNIVSASA